MKSLSSYTSFLLLVPCVYGGPVERRVYNGTNSNSSTIRVISTGSTVYETFSLVYATPTTSRISSSSQSTVYETFTVEPVPLSSASSITSPLVSSVSGSGAVASTVPPDWVTFTETFDRTSTTITTTGTQNRDYTYTETFVSNYSLTSLTTVTVNPTIPQLHVQTNTWTFPYISTTLTETETFADQLFPTGTEVPINGNRCQYYGIGCPPTGSFTATDLYQSLYVSNEEASIQECSRTIISSQALAKSSEYTFTETVVGPSTIYEGFNSYGSLQSSVIPYTTSYVTTFTSWVSRPAYEQFGCCGQCALTYSSVDVYYFPEPGKSSCIYDPAFSNLLSLQTQTAPITARKLMGRAQSLSSNGSTLVNSNGFTFTSPSIYVGFSNVRGNDLCGQVGGNHGAFTLGFAPGDLFTLSGELGQPAHTTGTFDINSVTCGSRPIIAVPDQLLSYDPAWSTCIGNFWQGNDPPYALIPYSVLASTTALSPPQTTTASPSSLPSALPIRTTTAVFNPAPQPSLIDPSSPPQSVDPGQSVPAKPSASNPVAPPASIVPGPPANGPSNVPQSVDPGQSSSGNLPFVSISAQPAGASPVIIKTFITTTSDGQIATIPILSVVSVPPGNPSSSTGGLGGAIISAFGNPVIAPSALTPEQITVGTEIGTVINPSAVVSAIVLGGSTIIAGSAPVIVNGQTVSLLPLGGGIALPTTTVALPALPANTILTIGSELATVVNLSAIAIGGSILTPGSSPVTVGGQAVSFVSNGALLAGTSTVVLPVAPQATQALATIAGQTIVDGPSGIQVDGSTLVPGGPTITIGTTPVYVNTAGLVVGLSTITLPLIIPAATTGRISAEPSIIVLAPGTTLTLGGPTSTISGTAVYYGTGGLVMGTSTMPLPGVTGASTTGLGGSKATTSRGLGAPFEGSAMGLADSMAWLWGMGMAFGIGTLAML